MLCCPVTAKVYFYIIERVSRVLSYRGAVIIVRKLSENFKLLNGLVKRLATCFLGIREVQQFDEEHLIGSLRDEGELCLRQMGHASIRVNTQLFAVPTKRDAVFNITPHN